MIMNHPKTFYSNEKAGELANILNSDPEDDWTYIVKNIPENPRFSVIEVYDEENVLSGYL